MQKKYYDKEINDATDWGGDTSTGGLQVCGRRVQEYIKKKLSEKLAYEENSDPSTLLS